MPRQALAGGNPKSSLGGPRTAREVAGRPRKGPSSYTHNQARIAKRASCSCLAIRARHFHINRIAFIAVIPICWFVFRIAKARSPEVFDSPGFAWEFRSMIDALFRRSPEEGAIHDQALGILRTAGRKGRSARLGLLVDDRIQHGSRKNSCVRDDRMLPCSIRIVKPFYNENS
jgi:hypothetical protein